MKYLYYPGCSLEGTAREYDISTKALLKRLGVELVEIKEWTCCGASAAAANSHLLSFVLSARNLAIAETMEETEGVVAPCTACYLNLKNVGEKVKTDLKLHQNINKALAEVKLRFDNTLSVSHLLEVVVKEGPDAIRLKLKRSLEGLRIAPYYGCQSVRPYPVFDDQEQPTSMEPIIEATGAKVHHWTMGATCCGATHMNLKPEVGKKLVGDILREANDADVIVTVCPMCQLNLEAYQGQISRNVGQDLSTTILYLPQLLGLVLGFSEEELCLNNNLAITKSFRTKIAS